MKDTRNARIKIVFVLAATALVLVYVYLIAPYFLAKTDTYIVENNQIEHDLREIEDMGSDTDVISDNIATAKEQLAKFEKKAGAGSSGYDMDISEKADDADVTISEMMVEESSVIGQQSATGKTLYLQPLTITFTGSFSEGIEFIESLEKSDTGIYKVQDFLYSSGSDDEEKSWMLSIDVYYYEGDDSQQKDES